MSGNVPIGEKLTVSLYLNDGANRFDLQVRRCHAYDAGNFTDQNTQRLALTDRHGCSTRPHLLSTFLKVKHLQNRPELTSRLTNDRARTANVMVYAVLNAFRFPEQSDVYVSCSVEVCSGECDNSCQPEVNSPDDPIPIPQPQRPLKPHHHHHSKRKPQQQVEIKIPNMSVSNSTPLLNDVDQESEFNNVHVIRDDSNENDTAITANFLFNAFNQQDSLATIALNSGPKLVTSHDLVTGHRLSANDTRWNESLPINVTSRTLTVRDRSPESQLNGSRLVIVSTELPGRATFGQLRSNRINRVDRTRRINSKSMQNF